MRPHLPASRILLIALGVLQTLTIGGCARSVPTALEPRANDPYQAATPRISAPLPLSGAAATEFYPVAIGNRWRYRAVLRFDVPGDADAPQEFNEVLEIEQIGFESLLGRQYFVEEERFFTESGSPILSARYRYRQDRSGLYNLDPLDSPPGASAPEPEAPGEFLPHLGLFHSADRVLGTIADPARRAAYRTALVRLSARFREEIRTASALPGRTTFRRPGGVEAHEITILRYPLHPGQHWIIRADPRFEATVEGQEVLDLPAGRFNGWRRAIRSEFFGPNDRVLLWHGRKGYLALQARFELQGTSPGGGPEIAVFEQSVQLDRIDLTDHPGQP